MNTTTRISAAERLGRSFGRVWRAYARGERRVSNWLVSKGVPVAGATVLLWGIKLAVLGVLLYAAFWLALLLAVVIAVAWGAVHASTEDDDVHGSKAQDHREDIFYHPFHHDDDPDPRFGDDQ